MSLHRVAIIGLGLMGGSLGLALKRAGLAAHVCGCGRQVLIDRARELGAVDSGSTSAADAVADADFVFLCTPVETSLRLMAEIAPHLKPSALLTDVGSTKLEFAQAAQRIFGAEAARRVLPGHPMAGREVSGLENADVDLYQDSVWALTPLDAALDVPSHNALRQAIATLGARVVELDAAAHDRALAYTSHLPQMLSTALAMTLQREFADAASNGLQIHGGGLRTMLRLAVSDPVMWEQVAGSNLENIASAMEAFAAELRSLRQSLGQEEFRRQFEQAREFALILRKSQPER